MGSCGILGVPGWFWGIPRGLGGILGVLRGSQGDFGGLGGGGLGPPSQAAPPSCRPCPQPLGHAPKVTPNGVGAGEEPPKVLLWGHKPGSLGPGHALFPKATPPVHPVTSCVTSQRGGVITCGRGVVNPRSDQLPRWALITLPGSLVSFLG